MNLKTIWAALEDMRGEARSEELDAIVNFSGYARKAWIAAKAATLAAGTRILDAGAGECQYRSLFSHCEYRAQDFAQYPGTTTGPLQESWKYGQLDYVCDIADMPVADDSFDAVLCSEVLEHVQRPIDAIRELSRVIRPAGRMFLTAPLASGLHQRPHHYYGGYTPHFYQTYLPQHGIEVVEIRPLGGLMLHTAQEVHRVGRVLHDAIPGKLPTFARFVLLYWLPRYLATLELQMPLEEFTVGYLVEGRKLG